jgi:hypothetical protein
MSINFVLETMMRRSFEVHEASHIAEYHGCGSALPERTADVLTSSKATVGRVGSSVDSEPIATKG